MPYSGLSPPHPWVRLGLHHPPLRMGLPPASSYPARLSQCLSQRRQGFCGQGFVAGLQGDLPSLLRPSPSHSASATSPAAPPVPPAQPPPFPPSFPSHPVGPGRLPLSPLPPPFSHQVQTTPPPQNVCSLATSPFRALQPALHPTAHPTPASMLSEGMESAGGLGLNPSASLAQLCGLRQVAFLSCASVSGVTCCALAAASRVCRPAREID